MKLLSVVGARPQFIKLAPIDRAILCYNQDKKKPIEHCIVHTNQHYDANMSEVHFEELHLPKPDHHLGVGSGPHGQQTGRMLEKIETIFLKESPDVVLVFGDTNSTLAGALAAAKLHIPLAHVEAGLRSYNKHMPEEINRTLTDHVSEWLFCPTSTAVENLHREGIIAQVHQVGDVMYDAVRYSVRLAQARDVRILEQLDLTPKNYMLATVHRAENTDDLARLEAIFLALENIGQEGVEVLLPLHPRTKNIWTSLGLHLSHVRIIEPVSYLEMLLLEKHASVILTDSGGVQKEAYWFEVPCITMRSETEWVETVEAGWNTLVDCDQATIVRAAQTAALGEPRVDLYGHGNAADLILKTLT